VDKLEFCGVKGAWLILWLSDPKRQEEPLLLSSYFFSFLLSEFPPSYLNSPPFVFISFSSLFSQESSLPSSFLIFFCSFWSSYFFISSSFSVFLSYCSFCSIIFSSSSSFFFLINFLLIFLFHFLLIFLLPFLLLFLLHNLLLIHSLLPSSPPALPTPSSLPLPHSPFPSCFSSTS
jgi:hypothetical protein